MYKNNVHGFKILKRVIASVLMFILVFSFSAQPIMAEDDSETLDSALSIDEQITGILRAAEFDLSEDYTISEAYEIQNSSVSDNVVYFVFCDDKCVGEVVTSLSSGSISFFQEKCDEITEIYLKSRNISVACFDEESWGIISDNQMLYLYGIEKNIAPSVQGEVLTAKPIVLSDLTINSLDRIPPVAEPQRLDYSAYLSVPFRANACDPSGNGLCWLASALSMIDYQLGNTGYTTLTLYNYMSSLYSALYGPPTGTTEYILRAFYTFDIYMVANQESGLPFYYVEDLIDENKPILSVIMTENLSASHAVVICGYRVFSPTGMNLNYYYRIMDPNCSNYVTITNVNPSSSNYTYVSGSYTYTKWTSRYHLPLNPY